MAYKLANLPIEVQDTLSRADTSYLFGWSHGKELMNGVRRRRDEGSCLGSGHAKGLVLCKPSLGSARSPRDAPLAIPRV